MWLIILAAYEMITLMFWRRVFHDGQMNVRQWIPALLLSWIVSPIAAITMLIVYIAEMD